MANDRRGGIGFGNEDEHDDWDDGEVEATRAMDLVDDEIPDETVIPGQLRAPEPPRRPVPAPLRRSAGREEPIEEPPDDEDGEDATRMLDAIDFDGENFGPPPEPEPEGVKVEVRVIAGPDRGKHHDVNQGDHLVGRGLDCGIVLADPAVSRKHFRLLRSGDVVEVIDMGGANGTNVNGQTVSRQRLNPGDQLEVGTTVLEFWIEGADKPVRESFSPSAGTAPPVAETSGPSMGVIIGTAVAGLVVLVGGGVAAYFMIGGSDDVTEEVKAAPEDKKIAKMIEDAKDLLDEREWGEAVDKLKEAKKLSPKDSEVKGLLAKALDEVDYAEALDEGREAAKDKRYAEAVDKFKDVPNTSEQYTDAQEELAAAKEEMFGVELATARSAVDAGDNKKAEAALKEILKVDPKNSEAKVMLAKLLSADKDDAEGAGAKPGAGGDKAGGAAPPKSVNRTGQSAKSLLSGGLKSYHNRKWSDALRAFTTVASGPFDKKSRSKAAVYQGAVNDVALGFQTASSVSSPLKRARAFKKAYGADRRIDGHFGPSLVTKLSGAYVQAAKALFKGHRYPEAADAVREAMNFDPESADAQRLEKQCIDEAGKLLKKAKDHMNRKNYATARDYARQVTRILPAMDPRAGEARKIRKDASEASIQGDDD
jgi:tetratricopeptide (TPR) repeat protein